MLQYLFLSSGTYFGWALGANDAANVRGPAVGYGYVFNRGFTRWFIVIAGSIISGLGGSPTIGAFASVKTLSGAFIITFSASTVLWMRKQRIPVSNTHAVAELSLAGTWLQELLLITTPCLK
ncbi:MAG: hypothetical protein SNJ78_09270 [Spirochaetales bacterium]